MGVILDCGWASGLRPTGDPEVQGKYWGPLLGAVTASLPGNGRLGTHREPVLQVRGHRHSWGPRKPSLPLRPCQTGAPSRWGSWKSLPAPLPPRCPLLEPGPCSPPSLLPAPPTSPRPQAGPGQPQGSRLLFMAAKCHRTPAENLSWPQRSLIFSRRSFLPGLGCDPEACVEVSEDPASVLSPWLPQLSAAAGGVWFPDQGLLPAPNAGSPVLQHQLLKTQPVAAIQTQGLQGQGRGRPWGVELPGGTTSQGLGW